MKKISIFTFLLLFSLSTVFAEMDPIEQAAQDQVDSWLGTIKVYLSEHGECKDILTNKVIKGWYLDFIEAAAKPIETRTAIYSQQSGELQKQIDMLKTTIDTKNQELKDKKQAFLDEYIVSADNDAKLKEFDTLKNDILAATCELNLKTTLLKSITDDYNRLPHPSREEITKLYESRILSYCTTWYGKVELTDKRTLEQSTSKFDGLTNTAPKVNSKYKKMFDTIDIVYVKNPNTVKQLYSRVDKVVRKISKSHKSYDLLISLRSHILSLMPELNK